MNVVLIFTWPNRGPWKMELQSPLKSGIEAIFQVKEGQWKSHFFFVPRSRERDRRVTLLLAPITLRFSSSIVSYLSRQSRGLLVYPWYLNNLIFALSDTWDYTPHLRVITVVSQTHGITRSCQRPPPRNTWQHETIYSNARNSSHKRVLSSRGIRNHDLRCQSL